MSRSGTLKPNQPLSFQSTSPPAGWNTSSVSPRDSGMACRRLPESDDRVDEALRLRGPTRPIPATVFGEFAFAFGAGVHQQVSRHRDSLRANAFGKIGKALVDPFDRRDEFRRSERVLRHDLAIGRICHRLRGEARVPARI